MHANIKIIGQLSAAENIFHVFPSNDKIGDFAARALKKVPGVAGCSICICGEPRPSGDLLPDFCDGCDIGSTSADSDEELVCRFDGRENHDIYFLKTPARFFGFLIVEIEDPAQFSPYAPFISNFSNTITINMENLWQKEQLQTKNTVLKQHRQNLESLIKKRTQQLSKTQEEHIALEKKLHNARKAESLGRMAGAIAHHFNNQLNVVMGNLEMALEDSPADAVYRENLTAAMHAAQKSAEISGLMLTYVGQGSGETSRLELSRLCLSYLPILRTSLPGGIALETDFMSVGAVVLANANHMQMILSHLITNAAEAIGENTGRIKLSTKIFSVSDIPKLVTAPVDWQPDAKMYACVEVSDTGCGINDQDMEKLFDPFFTTKFTGRGLGLSVALGWVKSWDGALCVESKKGRGTCVRILLPVQENMDSPQTDAVSQWQPDAKGGTVLLVDDQDAVRKIGEVMLQRLGFSPITAASGPEAVAVFRRHQDRICCVITDLTMPDMDGWETLAALRK
ncbi:MAG: ATP-binding protein, partial [Desulfotignum sp.]